MVSPYHVRLAISQYGEQLRAELFTEDLGDTDGDLLPARWEVLDQWLPYLVKGGSLPPDSARKVGQQLFDYLLGQAENSKKWTEILQQLERQQRPLRLLVDATTDAVRDLPYGLLCEPHDDYFLFRPSKARPAIQFVRILRRCTPRVLKLGKPIRVLVAIAEPHLDGVPTFNAAERLCELGRGLIGVLEVHVCTPGGPQRLDEAVGGVVERWKADQFAQFCRTTREGLRAALKGGDYDVLHLIAHGLGSSLGVCDSTGKVAEVTASELGEWCGESSLRMAFLQVCRGSQTGERGGFGGLAQQLLNPKYGNLAAVVASPYPVDAERSTPAAINFYRSLARGESPDAALDRGLEETNWTWAFLELWVRPQALAGTGARGAFQYVSPYRGLARFEERDADIFFGREAEIAEVLQLLDKEIVVTVAGDSGSGKSSLLQAGLGHRVRAEGLAGKTGWQILSVQPGLTPMTSLISALRLGESQGASPGAKEPKDLEELRSRLTDDLHKRISKKQPLLLVLDQFEEVFTLCESDGERRVLGGVLGGLVSQESEDFRLVLGIRCDYLGKAAALPGLDQYVKRPWVLKPPGAEQVRTIVEQPATKCGYVFQGPQKDGKPGHEQSLVERILNDPLLAHESRAEKGEKAALGAPLPLLEFALERLWLKTVGLGSKEFRHEGYDELGGLAGAIAGHADEVYQSLSLHANLGPEPQALAEKIFVGLVSSSGTRRPRRRSELEEETGKPVEAKALIDHLVGERLLTVRSDASDLTASSVDLAHEVLISAWKQLKDWLDTSQVERRLREEVAAAGEKWKCNPVDDFLEHRGSRLVQVEELLRSTRFVLSATEREYVEACINRRDKEQREKEEQQQRELEAAHRLAEERRLRLEELERLREITLAQVLAAQARRQPRSEQDERAALLARQAYLFNRRSGGPALNQIDDALRARLALPFFSTVLSGPEGKVNSMAFSPDGKRLAANGAKKVWLWELRRPEAAPVVLSDSGEWVQSVAFSPDGDWLAAGGDRKTWLWEMQQPEATPVVLNGADGWVRSVAFSPDGKWLAGTGDRKVWLWELKRPEVAPVVLGCDGEMVGSVVFSPVGDRLAAGGDDGKVRLWEWQRPDVAPVVVSGTNESILSVAFSPDGERMVAGSWDGKVRLWELRQLDAAPLVLSGPRREASSVAFSSDGERLAVAGRWDSEVWLWEMQQPSAAPVVLSGADGWVQSMAFSPDGKRLAAGGGKVWLWEWQHPEVAPVALSDTDKRIFSVAFSSDGERLAACREHGEVQLWELHEAEAAPVVLRGPEGAVRSVAFSPDGKRLAAGGEDRRVRLWEWQHPGVAPVALNGTDNGIFSVAFSPDGKWLAAGGEDMKVRLWELQRIDVAPIVLSGPISRPEAWVLSFSVAFSPDGKRLVAGGGEVWLWELQHPEVAPVALNGTDNGIFSVAFSPDGKRLAAGGEDGKVRLWELHRPEAAPVVLNGTDNGIFSVAFSPDGKRLAAGGEDRKVLVWEMEQIKVAPVVMTVPEGQVGSVTFSPDGKRLAAGGEGGKVRLWELHRPEAAPVLLNGTDNGIFSVAFSPDGKRLAAGGEDQKVWIHIACAETLADLVCSKVRRNMTRTEWNEFVGPDVPYECTCPGLPPGEGAATR